MLWSIGCGILISALGVLIWLKPELLWEVTEKWKSCAAEEPSEFYRKTTRIGGVLFALTGLLMIVLPLILE